MTHHAIGTPRLWTRRLLTTCLTAALGAPMLAGATSQQQSADGQALPQFEVASIKPDKSGDRRMMMRAQPGGRFEMSHVTLKAMIRNAYQVQDFQLVGGPNWIDDDHFDVIAKAEQSGSGDPFRAEKSGQPSRGQLMLRALLAERFKLAVHTDTREMPIYALVLARGDGKLGPQFQKSTTDCAAGAAGRGPGAAAPPAPGPAQANGPMPCGIRVAPGNMAVGGSTLTLFANSLGMFVDRIVIDRTGLTDRYDFTLTWTPDQMGQRPPGAPEPPFDPNGPSIFTAVQEQLGLKLDSQKGPVTVLVIDHAEHPVED
jgi:bla regulator protein BlaR1